MTEEQIKNKADTLYALFSKMPNGKERALYFNQWFLLREKQNKFIYKVTKNE